MATRVGQCHAEHGWQVIHEFMCEKAPKKQKYLADKLPGVKLLFTNAHAVATGRSENYLSDLIVDVPHEVRRLF